MKKLLIFVMVLSLISLTACGENGESTSLDQGVDGIIDASGVYTGSGTGHNGPVSVEVVIDGDIITDIIRLDDAESSGLGDQAFDLIRERVVDNQSLNVDIVTGATISSVGYRTAIEDAISKTDLELEILKSAEVKAPVTEDTTIETNVVVVGSGVAGLTAAISAAEKGSDVVLLEKLDRLGGTTIFSGAMVVVSNTEFQQAKGIEDTDDGLLNYWLERNDDGLADEDFIRYVAEKSHDILDFLVGTGLNFADGIITYSGTADIARAHMPVGMGASMIESMSTYAENVGVEIISSADVNNLLMEDGNIVGVEAEYYGTTLTVKADATILATGGFASNEEMVEEYAPMASGSVSIACTGSTGDGIVLGMDAGAATEFKDGAIGAKVVSARYLTTTSLGALAGSTNVLMVNKNGERFVNESLDYPYLFEAMSETDGDKYYFIYGAEHADNISDDDYNSILELLETGIESGVVTRADTVEDLEELLGMTSLVDNVARYSQNKDNDEFGKDSSLVSVIESGPYYALQVVKSTLDTFGGLVINLDAQVLNTDGNIINGLYAAGEVANSAFFGQMYPASGSAITHATVFGMTAGENAANSIK